VIYSNSYNNHDIGVRSSNHAYKLLSYKIDLARPHLFLEPNHNRLSSIVRDIGVRSTIVAFRLKNIENAILLDLTL